nr:putative UPF0481 protein At3g02645 [Tanacetum cinerariifolium]
MAGDEELGHVDIDDTVQLLLKNEEEVQNPSDQYPGLIFMVPKVYHDLSPPSFTPRVVSIGPLHHQDKHLKGFEVHKATYMHDLLHKALRPHIDSTPEQILKECVAKYPDHNSSRPRKKLNGDSVVELDRLGVRFLCFPLSWSKPTLKMPVLRLYDETETIIRNLIIYEQSAGVQTCVTSYMKVMDMLIDIPEDVAKLVKSQVLYHYLGSD